MKKWQMVTLIIVGALGLAALWSIAVCWIHQSSSDLTIPECIVGFSLGAIILGWLLLGQRNYWDACVYQSNFDRRIWVLILWAIGLAACAIPLRPGSWQITIAAIIGMVIGSLIWPPKASDDTAQFPPVSQKPSDSDASPAVSPGIPDFTQDTRHPGE